MPTKERPTTRLLREARKLIARPHGWTQFTLREGNAVCAYGALCVATDPENPYGAKVSPRAVRMLAKAAGVRGKCGIFNFNDAAKTRKKDVLAAFDKAIELSEAR